MDLSQFLSEATALARPSTSLRVSTDAPPVAYLHSTEPGSLLASVAHDDHWLNVYLNKEDGGHVETSREPAVSEIVLSGYQEQSLPPVDAVFLHGSSAMGAWLAAHDWPRDEPYNPNFPDPVPGRYEAQWQRQYPLYQGDVAAMLGGWHMPWPDGDWYDLADARLVLFTMWEAEPYVEVFQRGSEYTVIQRIT